MAAVIAVLQIHAETRAGAQLHNGRRIQHQRKAVFHAAHQRAGDFTGHCRSIAARRTTLAPVFQGHKAEAHILTRTGKAETRHADEVFHFRHRRNHLVGYRQRSIGTLFGGTGRQLHHHHQAALVFLRQERSGNAHKQECGHCGQSQVNKQHAEGFA